ncbi:hypothetical protein ACLOJK_040539 [Asimina triloba]
MAPNPTPIQQPQNVLHIPAHKFSLGCPILDRLFDGGIPTGSITELVSESGCGKTQLCLQLLLLSASSSAAASLFIHTEFPFPFRRLRQLSLSIPSPDDDNDPCDRIFIHAANSAADLLALLDRIDALLLAAPPPQQPPIRLIVIDSIAALFRSEFDNNPGDLRRRSLLFFKIAGKLKAQAARFGLAVVVTNQVVDLVDEEGANGLRIGNYEVLYSSGRRVCPALGLAWANCVNSRVFLSRSEESVGTRRRMHLVFSPHLPESSCEYVIVREGVFGVA